MKTEPTKTGLMETERRTTPFLRHVRANGCRKCPESGHPVLPCILGGGDYFGICHFHTHPIHGNKTYGRPGVWNRQIHNWT
jgi:hypothetical protein